MSDIQEESFGSLEEIRQKFLGKKHVKDPDAWLREKRKRLRVAGKEYINSKGVLVGAKNIGADCKCRRKCYETIPEDRRKALFEKFYNLNSHSEQNAYLFPLIKRNEIARKRKVGSERRSCTFKYFVNVNGDTLQKNVQVCREAFANIHGISVHKVRVLCSKMEQNIESPRDERGRHKNRPNRLNPESIELVKQHIQSIIESDNISSKFKQESGRHSAIRLNITKMWEDFCSNNRKLPNPDSSTNTYDPVIKLWVYYRLFNELAKSKYAGMLSFKESDSTTLSTNKGGMAERGNFQCVPEEVLGLQTGANDYMLHEHNEFDIPQPAACYTVLDCSESGAGTDLALVSTTMTDSLINSSGLEPYDSLQLSHATSDSNCQSSLLNNINIASQDSSFGCYIAQYEES